MDYDSMDWELEAKRVARAFSIEERCEFQLDSFGDETAKVLYLEGTKMKPSLPWGERLYVYYGKNDRQYQAFVDGSHWVSAIACIDWEGKPMAPFYFVENQLFFARAWFYLGLLTKEVEAALELAVTAHQKLEWALEYESKYGG